MITTSLDVDQIRKDFPLLERSSHGRRLVYLDSAATSQRPLSVMNSMTDYYQESNANVHRGVYQLAEEATTRYEAARASIGRFIGAPDPSREVVFTKNATEAFNLLATALGQTRLARGGVIVLSQMEHHANLVPWLMVAQRTGAELRYLDFDEQGQLDLSDLDRVMTGATVVALTMASNVLGTETDLEPIIATARASGALVILDAAQYVPHNHLDVASLGADFVAFSGHKMLGPTGVGVLWGRTDRLEALPPFMGGGEMITDVRLDGFEPNEIPWRFEAGTPPIAEAIGLERACQYLDDIGLEVISRHDQELTWYAHGRMLEELDGLVRIYGPDRLQPRAPLLSFSIVGVHPHDIAQVLDETGVCVRAGHHCAKPLMRRLGVPATVRASFYLYNERDDVEELVSGLAQVRSMFCPSGGS